MENNVGESRKSMPKLIKVITKVSRRGSMKIPSILEEAKNCQQKKEPPASSGNDWIKVALVIDRLLFLISLVSNLLLFSSLIVAPLFFHTNGDPLL